MAGIDVDEQLVHLNALNKQIMTDSIGPAEAKALLQAIVRYDKPAF